MSGSPVMNKLKTEVNEQRRPCESDANDTIESSTKIIETESSCDSEGTIIALKKKNFIKACEKVSCESYRNQEKRFLLFETPRCASGTCDHMESQKVVCK